MKLQFKGFCPVAMLFGAALILSGWAPPVHAGPFLQTFIQAGAGDCEFSGGAGVPSPCGSEDEVVGASSVSASASSGGGNFPEVNGAASARVGSLGNFAEAISRVEVSGNPTVGSNAAFFLDDLIFTGPSGATEITTSLNVFVDGAIGGSRIANGPNRRGEYSLTLFADGNFIGSGSVFGDIAGSAIANTGLFAGSGTSSSVNGIFAANPFTFALNTPHSLRFNAFASAAAVSASTSLGPFGTEASRLVVDFSSTARFAGTVFDLPDGFTVNSLQAGINGNNFGVPAIPLPAALPLFLTAIAGLGGFGFMRRRKTR